MDVLDKLDLLRKLRVDPKGAEAQVLMEAKTEIESLRQQVKERTDFEIAIKDDNERLYANQ